jgi:hypothetical protein
MGLHQQFHQAATERGIPEEETSVFAEFLRFAIRTDRHPAGTGAVVGRSGGLPLLPVGTDWPSSSSGPLPFVASLDCAALPPVDGLALPADGSLLVFLHHEWADEADSVTGEQEFARVVYVPAGTETARAEAPAHTEDMFYDTTLDFVGPEHDLFATVAANLPSWFDVDDDEDDDDEDEVADAGEHLGLHLPHLGQLRALVAELWPEAGGVLHLGGHSTAIGALRTEHMYEIPESQMADDILRERARAGELPPGEREPLLEKETLRLMREWVPLVQFEPDDVHRARLLIRHDDLAARRFDRTVSFTAFTE